MIYQEADRAFVIYKFLGTSYYSPEQDDKDIFLEMNLARNLQVLVNSQWVACLYSKRGVMWGVCVFRNVTEVGCSPALRAHLAMEADASENQMLPE